MRSTREDQERRLLISKNDQTFVETSNNIPSIRFYAPDGSLSDNLVFPDPLENLEHRNHDSKLVVRVYTQLFIVHLLVICTWGMNTSFGVFQSFYTDKYRLSLSQASLVGSSQTTLFLLVGVMSGRFCQPKTFKTIIIVGGLFQVTALMLLTQCTQFWSILATHGILFGIGGGITFTPCLALVACLFPKTRAVAISAANLGSATGGILFPALMTRLWPWAEFSATILILAAGIFVVYLFAVLVLIFPEEQDHDVRAVSAGYKPATKAPFLLYLVGSFFFWWVLYFGLYYITQYGESRANMSHDDAVSLLMVMVTCGLPFRIIPSIIADRWMGPLNILAPFCLISGGLMLLWAECTSAVSLYIWSGAHGACLAVLQSLFTPAILTLTIDSRQYGSRIGLANGVVSLAVLSGPPLVGRLVEMAGGKYWYAQLFAASSMTSGGLLILSARIALTGPRFRVKA